MVHLQTGYHGWFCL